MAMVLKIQSVYLNIDLPVGDLSRVLLLQVRELDPGGLRDLRQGGSEDALQLGMHRCLGLVRRRLILFRRSQGITASPSRVLQSWAAYLSQDAYFSLSCEGLLESKLSM